MILGLVLIAIGVTVLRVWWWLVKPTVRVLRRSAAAVGWPETLRRLTGRS